jgi:NADPH2 dehydrogenase
MKNARYRTFEFGNGKVAKNRIVVPPMASQTADARGYATGATVAHYRNLAGSGAGLVFVEYSFIHSSGRGEERQLGIESDKQVAGLAQVAQAIRDEGSMAGVQIVHVGGKTTVELSGAQPIGASTIAVPVKGWQPEAPREANQEDIHNLIQWYVDAAKRGAAAGFDMVELHAAHGYGLNQWLSPITNQRTDIYGGSIEARARLLLRIVKAIRMETPDLLLAVRLPAQDHMPGGLILAEMIWVVQRLEEAGVDLIDVSSGLGGWRRPGNREGQGYLVEDATALRNHTLLPVIGVGGIESGAFIDEVILGQKVDFAAVGRAILRAPQAWGDAHINKFYPCRKNEFRQSRRRNPPDRPGRA